MTVDTMTRQRSGVKPEKTTYRKGWIGVDLHGTLAHYDGWVGPTDIGPLVAA